MIREKDEMTAIMLLAPREKAIVIRTDGRDLVINPDGSGISGYWRINKRRTHERCLSKVIVYWNYRQVQTPPLGEIFVGQHDGTFGLFYPDMDAPRLFLGDYLDVEAYPEDPRRNNIHFRNLAPKGVTHLSWKHFAMTDQNPIRFLP